MRSQVQLEPQAIEIPEATVFAPVPSPRPHAELTFEDPRQCLTPRFEEKVRDFQRWGYDFYGWSLNTRRNYASAVRRAERWFRAELKKPLIYSSPKDLEKFFLSSAVRPTPVTRNGTRSALIRWFEFLGKTEKNNPAEKLPKLKRAQPVPRALSVEDGATLASKIGACPDLLAQTAAALFLYAGLRFHEALGLRWTEISLPFMRVRGKGNKERIVPVHPDLQKQLLKWKQECPSAEFLFPSPWPSISKPMHHTTLRKYVGPILGAVLPHVCRHTFATAALEQGALNVRELQSVLGHSSPSTTAIYLTVRPMRIAENISKLSYRKEHETDG